MELSQVRFSVVNDQEHTAVEYAYQGQTYICGIHGQNYNLRVTNNSSRRIVAVISVDGLSIMNGEPASANGTGYILDPWQTQRIPGWRLDNTRVARFAFGGAGASYAVLQGQPANIGVIGLVAYAEKPRPSSTKSVHARRGAGGSSQGGVLRSAGPMSESQPMVGSSEVLSRTAGESVEPTSNLGGSLGTAFGQEATHCVQSEAFHRDGMLCHMCIRYEDAQTLERMGILHTREIDPFPADASQGGCLPPPGWRR